MVDSELFEPLPSVAGHSATVFNYGWQVRQKKQISTRTDISFPHTNKQKNLPFRPRHFHPFSFYGFLLEFADGYSKREIRLLGASPYSKT